jgi:hypothetical protein
MRCCAVLAGQWKYQVERVQLCQNGAAFRVNGVPLCGTHINRPPERVVMAFEGDITTAEKI